MAVELNVQTQLRKIVEDLEAISSKARTVGDSLRTGTEAISDDLNKQVKETETFLEKLSSLGGRVANQLRGDFRSLISLNALTESMRLSEQFKGSIREALSLSDAIRKIGPTLGIVSGDFVRFQAMMLKGLGDLGIGSEAATSALQGLAQTPVRGEANLIEYSKTAGELASLTKEQGREGDIARLLSQVVVSQGRNPNDMSEMKRVSEDALRVRLATGRGASESLGALSDLYAHANRDFLPTLRQGGGVTLASAALLGGKDATSFLERYVGMNRIERMGMEAQGLGKIINGKGELDPRAVEATLKEASGRGLGDAQAGLRTFGLSDEEAKGFIRLGDALRENAATIDQAKSQVVDLTKSYRESMGFGEAFRANLNKVKSLVATPLGMLGNGGANLLEKTSESTGGALAITVGGGLLAALLAGFGLKGVGGALGGLAKGAAIEGATGRAVQPVYVTNAAEIKGSGVGDVAKGAGLFALGAGEGILGGVLLPLLAAAGVGAGVGYGAGKGIRYAKDRYDVMMTPSKSLDKIGNENLSRLSESIDRLASSPALSREAQTKLLIENRSRDLKASVDSSRGASFGP